jgi:hypothetical protein
MSDSALQNHYLQNGPTNAAATNYGNWQASQGQTCSGQQPGESHACYTARVSAYEYTKSQQGK